ncbi:MAG: peptidoglycan DD-metalloendopeptidase family protein [Candidatus Moranbacteria bacterium]|nr:peptidoglycan DD-metalloendopeptidase family protein [Candidatus Moranbacteria bacterium]
MKKTNKKYCLLFLIFLILVGFLIWIYYHNNFVNRKVTNQRQKKDPEIADQIKQQNQNNLKEQDKQAQKPLKQTKRSKNNDVGPNKKADNFTWPIDQPKKRITKKEFAQYITRENSPIENERFRGFHTGVDLEVFNQEIDQPTQVQACCTGKLVYKGWINGYGGVVVQSCEWQDQSILILYGHVKLTSVKKSKNDLVKQGEFIAFLGQDKSQETDQERKHLHLGIIKGEKIDFRGYVQQESELKAWYDPVKIIGYG